MRNDLGWRLALAALALAQAAAAQPGPPHVRVLATGGTIAGIGNSAGTGYRSGMVAVADLIAALPGAGKIAAVTAEQVANVSSSDIDEVHFEKRSQHLCDGLLDHAIQHRRYS